jgi:alpha-L-fucosidase
MKEINAEWGVLTAKHGCGFLLWQTNVTLPDGSPYGYNVNSSTQVMRLFAEAAAAAGMFLPRRLLPRLFAPHRHSSVLVLPGLGYGWYYSLTNNFYLNEFGHSVKPPSTLLPGQANVTQAQYEGKRCTPAHKTCSRKIRL